MKKTKEIYENPGDYFNFGFNMADYKKFLILLFTKRVQRSYIDEKVNMI